MAAAAVIDTSFLASYYAIPQPSIQSLIDQPTSDLVASFLKTVVVRAQDHDKLKSERLRLEVELENAVRNGDAKVRTWKAAADKANQEVASLREALNNEENTRNDLTSQVQNLQSSTASSSTELQTLQAQVSKLEKSNRETLSLLDAKSTAHDKLAEELSAQHQKVIGMRRDMASLEERNQTTLNDLSTAKFEKTSFQHEIDRQKRSNEWHESELKAKTEEFTKFRKEKNARIAELQRNFEDSTSNAESLKRTDTTLRKRIEELSQKADSAYAKIQQLQEDATRAEESFRAELDSSRRLAELQKQGADTAKRRVQELEDSIDKTKDDAANEIGQLQSEVESEREEREAAERKVEQYESDIENLNFTIANLQQGRSVPGSPRLGMNGTGTPGRPGTPSAFSPSRSRGGLSMTQMYSEYNNMKSELDSEKRTNEGLRASIDEMIKNLESKEPELREREVEIEHLRTESAHLSSLLTQAGEDRDRAKKDARKVLGRAEAAEKRNQIFQQQARDLGSQVKMLVFELQVRDADMELDENQRQQLQHAAKGFVDPDILDKMTDTDRFISEQLVPFKTVAELQERNVQLTRIAREIGEQLESEEAKEKAAQQEKDRAELEQLRERLERYKDEMKAILTKSEAFVRERDMFRRILTQRGKLPSNVDASMLGDSLNGSPAPPQTPQRATPMADQSPHSRELADYAKLVKELQTHFDAYKEESATDLKSFKSQVDSLGKEKNQLQAEIARVSSQLTLAQERYEMLQSNYNQLKSESEQIRERWQKEAETSAKQDLRIQKASEDLVESQSLTESLRNENSNLKAEKEWWKRVETRLTEDNSSLVEERGRLNKMLTDSQSLQNERQLADSEARRKLESQVETLEAELKSTKQKLEAESEASKNANVRREYEQEQSRTRIDDLVKSLSNVKEELASAKTTRDQLQARVDELRIELRTAEERAQALQPRPTPRAETNTESTAEEDSALSREQELAIEVAELKKELDLAKGELENAKTQVEQYKAISQSSEEELASLNGSYDQYREEMDRLVAEKDANVQELEQRVQDISSEMSHTNTQLSELRKSAEENSARFEQQRSSLEEEIKHVKDDCERYKETASFHQQDLKAQAEIAQQAQQSYENELVKHAEAAQALHKVRSDYSEVKLEVSQAKADAEAARVALRQNEESWTTSKESYEKEIVDLKSRRTDVDAQNRILHEQLESVSSQIAALQQNRAPSRAEEDDEQPSESNLQNMQEVIRYLRREKEIVDVQYELSLQEGRRTKQQLDYTRSQLDEVRLKLDQERERQNDTQQSNTSHSKLMETINELNVFRESSVTLRNENRQVQAQVVEKNKRIEELEAQVQPLEASVRELESEKETHEGQIKLLEEDRTRWQQRTQQILQKYDRIDPAELENLKEQIKTLENERDNLATEKDALQNNASGSSQELKASQDQVTKLLEGREKMIEQFKSRSKEQTGKIKASEAERQTLSDKLIAAQAELEETKKQRDEALAAARAGATGAQATDPQGDLQMQNVTEEGQIRETPPPANSAEGQAQSLQPADNELMSLRLKVSELEAQIVELQQALESANAQVASAQAASAQAPDASTEPDEILNKLRQDLEVAQKEVENLRAGATSSAPTEAAGIPAAVEDQVAAKRAELDAAHEQKVQELESQYQNRVEGMKKQLTAKLTEGKNSVREQLGKQHEEATQIMQREHEAAIAKLKEDHQQEINTLRHELRAAKDGTTQPTAAAATKAPAGSENAFNQDSTPNVKAESTKVDESMELNQEQVQSLLANNQFLRNIFSRNLRNKLETETGKLKEEHEKAVAEKVADLQQKADKSKEQAVVMEGKKWNVKISFAEGKARNALAKIEVVEQAATNTPQRPVAEVWAIAKDVKAPSNASVATQSPAQPQAQPPAITADQPPHAGQPTPAAQSPSVRRPSEAPANSPATASNPEVASAVTNGADNTPAHAQSSETGAPEGRMQPSENAPVPSDAQSSKLPRGQPGAGTGPAALRGVLGQGSGIPRGGNIPRGNFSRGGRAGSAAQGGGLQSPTSPQAAPSDPFRGQRGGNSGSTTRGNGFRGRGRGPNIDQYSNQPQGRNMNPTANQFVPTGNKRPREEGSDFGNDRGKRQRGR